jgi:CDP-glucose 4,6-dehydratase
MIEPSFWSARRVLVTGHTGFKGSWLSLWLQRMGASVTGYALAPPTEPSLFEKAAVAHGIDSVTGDVRDGEHLAAVVSACRPEVVVHLAAQSLVRASYSVPVETYATNVMGTVHVLEAVRRVAEVRAVVMVTSDKCYANHEWERGYRESDALGGADPYSSSKAAAELVVAAYRRTFFDRQGFGGHGAAVASARAGNVIGGGDWAADRLIPDLVRGMLRGEPVLLRNPSAVRPFQHVLDALAGYLILAQRLYAEGSAFAEAWNFGPSADDACSVGRVADLLTECWAMGTGGQGVRGPWRPDPSAHPREAGTLRLDSSKARRRLGWSPRWSLGVALERCVVWYKAYQDAAGADDVRAATFADLDAYVGAPPVEEVDAGG